MIFERRIQILYYLMNDFREGVLASIFDDLDRVQHMFFHNRMDVVQDWYKRLDRFVGDVNSKVEAWNGKYRYLIMSDHGFSDFRNKVHLNRWLLENDFLCMQNGGNDLGAVDWSKTKAYAVGLNSIYLNVAGREGQGIVQADELEGLLTSIQRKIIGLEGRQRRLRYSKDTTQA